jgi:hypothetical protein
MKTLSTLFGKERSELETEIDKATSLNQVVELVQNRLDGLEKNYTGKLNVSQIRLASLFLDATRQSIASLSAANETQVLQPETTQIPARSKGFSAKSLILKVLQALICTGIFSTLFSLSRTASGAWMAILLMSLLVGLEVALQLDKDEEEKNSVAAVAVEAPQAIVRVDSKVLLDNIADALNTIDVAVARAEEVKKPLEDSGIEELPELLNVIQRLTGASFLERPQMALELTKLLPQILMEQGIRVQIYRPEEGQSDREHFDFEPNIDRDAKDYVTITPALFKGDRLLRRGRVIEPAIK